MFTQQNLPVGQTPQFVMFDLEADMRHFYEETAKMQTYEHCIDEIITEILRYIRDSYTAEAGLEAFAQDLYRCYGDDAEYLVPAAMRLGHSMLQQFELFGVYRPDGLLPYTLHSLLDNYTPIFQKHESEYTNIEQGKQHERTTSTDHWKSAMDQREQRKIESLVSDGVDPMHTAIFNAYCIPV